MKFYQIDIKNIKICASQIKDINKIFDSLNFISQKDKKIWNRVKKIKAIIVHPKIGYDNELFRPDYIWVCEQGTVRESTMAYLASLIVHESRHVEQYIKGVRNVDFRAEPSAYQDQIEFLEKYGEKYNADYVKKLYSEKFWKNNEFLTKKGGKYTSSQPLLKFLNKYKKKELNIKEIKEI